jgi:hypothetical protein
MNGSGFICGRDRNRGRLLIPHSLEYVTAKLVHSMRMFSKQSVLIALAVLLAGCYVYFFTDWIHRPRIQIIAQTRPIQPRGASAKVFPVSFLLDGQYRLSSVKVVRLSAFETNRYVPPLWHLVAVTNTPSIEGFLYGQRIPGMRPKTTNAPPQQLDPNTTYRLFVESGRARGQIDFRTSPLIEPNP